LEEPLRGIRPGGGDGLHLLHVHHVGMPVIFIVGAKIGRVLAFVPLSLH